MAELKGVVKSLAALDCYAGSGRNNGEYYRRDSTYESVISVKERDQLIKKLEIEIATIQDEVDDFNLTTQIVL